MRGDFPLSHGQRALWFLERLAPGNPAYLIAGAGRIRAGLDPAALRRALAALAARHPALRTTFHECPEGPRRRVHPTLEPELLELDAFSGSEAELGRLLAGAAFRPFDLAAGPLWRLVLVPLEGGARALALAIHHIVADFWSLGILVRDLGALYGAEAGGEKAALAPPGIDLEEWIARQEEMLAGPEGEELWQHWRGELADGPFTLDLPTDRPRPPAQRFRGGSVRAELPEELYESLRRQGRKRGATPFMVLLAAYQAVLSRWTGQERLLVGTPTTGRRSPEVAGLVGYLVNPVVVVADLAGEPTFEELLVRVRERCLAAFDRQAYPFPLLAERLQPERDPSRAPVFQTMFVLQKGRHRGEEGMAALWSGEPGAVVAMGPLALESIGLPEPGAQRDLSAGMAESDGRLVVRWQYDRDLFDAATVERMAGHFRTLLAGALSAPPGSLAARVGELPLLGQAERHQVLCEWSAAEEWRPAGTFLGRFAELVARGPDAIAVVAGADFLSRGELAARAGRLARRLRGLGVGPEVPVGLCAERSGELAVGLLAVLQAGGCYLPLDPALPPERLAFLVADARPAVLLAQDRLAGRLPAGAEVVSLDRLPAPAPAPALPALPPPAEGAAYLLYTSGSTGTPKGVVVPWRAMDEILLWQVAHLDERDRTLLKSSIGFDASLMEGVAPLAAGTAVVLARPGGEKDLPAIARLAAEERLTVLGYPPSVFLALLEQEAAGQLCLRRASTGTEAVPLELPARFYARQSRAVLHNLYGPTEATVFVLRWACGREERGPVPVGRPARGAAVYLLDRGLQPVPAGVAGEIFLGGAGLARGYLGRPELTAEKLVPHPFGAAGERLYRTGDLARYRPDGVVEFLGRIDQQVKIRGFRMELGEVEAALAGCPGVREAAVVAVGEGARRRLVGFVVPAGGGAGEPRERLETILPPAMVPAVVVTLEALPLTFNGKVDRRELEKRALAARPEGAQEAPRTPVEELLAGIWTELLGVERVGPGDDFFQRGGHSLLAVQLVSRLRERLGVELPLARVFENPTLAALAREAAASGLAPPQAPPVRPVPREGALPLSFAQERLWFLDRLEPGGAAYTIAGGVRLRGRLDAGALAAALAAIVGRHEALRTSFGVVAGRPVQVIAPARGARGCPLPVVDLRCLPQAERELAGLAAQEARRPFDLAAGPLLRTALVRLAEREHALLVTMHHAVADGWSLGIFVRELAALYGGAELPRLPVQYADFAVWQRRYLEGDTLARELSWWRRALQGAPQVLELPADRPRPAVASQRGERLPVGPAADLALAVPETARREGATPFMVLLAGFAVLLSRWTGREDLLVGSPVAGRTREETEGLIGFFVNTLALRVDLAGEPGFREILGRVKRVALGAYANQELPFEKLVEELAPERDRSRPPLVQAVLAYQRSPLERFALPGLELEPFAPETGAAKFDLTLALQETAGALSGSLEYALDLFDRPTVERLTGWFEALLRGACGAPERTAGELPLLGQAERHQVLAEWNDTGAPLDGLDVLAAFREWARRTPEALAVACGEERLTYGELHRRARLLAERLRRLGVGPETVVGLCAERSPELLVGIVGVLEAGGAYLPLDPVQPSARLAYALQDAGALLVLDSAAIRSLEAGAGAPSPFETPLPAQLAYVIYTSGSTGKPKGTELTHAGLANLVAWHRRVYEVRPEDRATMLAGVGFDASVWEVWPYLTAGASLWLPPAEVVVEPEALLAWMAEREITLAFLPTPLLEAALVAPLPRSLSLRAVLTGGDRLHRGAPEGTGFALVNHYGPTESTVVATAGRVAPGPGAPPIGRPIANLRVHLLDRRLRPVGQGAAGELCIGGAGLARGYRGRPDLTAERFVPDPLAAGPGERLYRTGDLARRRADGELEFLGRIDQQVKVRGFRIELGEVESALRGHPAVRTAAVVALEGPADRCLVAFVVPADGAALDPAALKGFLRDRLPAYMVPARFAALADLPLTPNAKLDRKALAELAGQTAVAEAERVAPQTPVEQALAEIWREVLGAGMEKLGVHDDFFALGGHSLKATQVLLRIKDAFGVELTVRRFLEAPTIAELALAVAEQLLAGLGGEETAEILTGL